MKHRKGRWKPKEQAVENARRELPLFFAEYLEEGQRLVRRQSTAAAMHEFRLSTKHFRYLLEVFRPLYGPRLDELLDHLKGLQTLLGELNDYAVTRQLLVGGADAQHPDTRQALRYLAAQTRKKRAEFRAFWKEVFGAPSRQTLWMEYLAGGGETEAAIRRKGPQRSRSRKDAGLTDRIETRKVAL